MSASKISAVLFSAGLFGMFVVVVLKRLPLAEYVIDVSVCAIALAGLIFSLSVVFGLCQEFKRSA